MKTAIYGGSFNPPHLGHIEVARSVSKALNPGKFLIIPDNIPPHKNMEENSPSPEQRLEMCALAFGFIENVEISDMEIRREGKSYTSETMDELSQIYPGDDFHLVIGTDMLQTFEEWYRFEHIFEMCTLTVLARGEDDSQLISETAERFRREYGAKIEIIPHEPIVMSSSEIREKLRARLGADMLDGAVYSLIIKNGYYDALPELSWLREKVYDYLDSKRIAHVAGCESEAVNLARRWGEDEEKAATAAILHDITKRCTEKQQLELCREYDIHCDEGELSEPKLLHAKTGAEAARRIFGVSDDIYNAIRWHTTGKPDMTLLEKIIYLADYIEPTRDFKGVEELRALAYEDIDAAMALGTEMSIQEIRSKGFEPYKDTIEACIYYNTEEK